VPVKALLRSRTVALLKQGGAVGILTLTLTSTQHGCREQVSSPLPCEQVPRDSLRYARHEEVSCSTGGNLAFRDAGVVCDSWGAISDTSLMGIYVLESGHHTPRRLLPWGYEPSWSPDQSKLVVGGQQLYIVDSSTGGFRRLTASPETCSFPAWDPTNTWIAYARAMSVWLVHPDGTEDHDIGSVAGAGSLWPSWNSTGTRILHSRPAAGAYGQEIYAMDPDGTNVVRITHNDTDDWYPAFSPDDQRVAYTACLRSGSFEIWVADANGTNARQVSQHGGWRCAWLPDGQHLVYTRAGTTCGGTDLGVLSMINVDTGEETQVTYPWPQRPEICR
jgi:Tol biopolymer transport system component